VWGPEIQSLKQKVKDLEESENQLLREFTSSERDSLEEFDKLEAKYTERMERIRENDLQDKEQLHRNHLRQRRKHLEEMKRHQDDQKEKALQRELLKREQQYIQQLEQEQNDLIHRFKQQVQSLEEQIERVKDGGEPGGDADVIPNELGLELANTPSRTGGIRVLNTSGLALKADIRNGDCITNVTRALDIRSRSDLAHLLPTVVPGEQMMLTLRRGNQELQTVLVISAGK
jgi:vacuolar-type H+-ATPase subunit E/Vma4